MAKKPRVRRVKVRPYRVPALKGKKIERRFNPDKLPKRDKAGRFVKKKRRARKRKPATRAPAFTGPQGSLF